MTDDRFPTDWHRLDADYYLCCIWRRSGLRSKVYVGGDGEIRTTFLRADRPEDAAMLAQVSEEAPAAIARLHQPAQKTRREQQRDDRPRRPMPARYPGTCVKTGVRYGIGDMIIWTTGGWAIADDIEVALNNPGNWKDFVPF
jgi:hypothetical protein